MKRLPILFGAAAALVAGGCNVIPPAQSDQTRYYVLTSPPEMAASSGTVSAGRLRVGLRSVELSQYLRGTDIVVRSGGNELQMQDYARWAEPLQAGITRVLREQIAVAPQVAEVQVQPFPLAAERDCEVAVTILHCEGQTGEPGRSARFEAVFQLSCPGQANRPVERRIFTAAPGRWDGRDFGALAALLSEDVAALGREIIQALPKGSRPDS